jgi:hypothetical protein
VRSRVQVPVAQVERKLLSKCCHDTCDEGSRFYDIDTRGPDGDISGRENTKSDQNQG